MDYKALLKTLTDHINENSKNNFNNMKNVNAQTEDRVRMAINPNIQGPQLPSSTDDEKKYYGNLSAAVGGSVAPTEGAVKGLAEEAAPQIESWAQRIKNAAMNPSKLVPAIDDTAVTVKQKTPIGDLINQATQEVPDVNGVQDILNQEKINLKYNGGIINKYKNLKKKIK